MNKKNKCNKKQNAEKKDYEGNKWAENRHLPSIPHFSESK